MKVSKLGILAASASRPAQHRGVRGRGRRWRQGRQTCYRPSCATSVKGHEGKCSGTRIGELKDEVACKDAGGAWTTAAEAKKFTDHDS
jgi:hypothetical protein